MQIAIAILAILIVGAIVGSALNFAGIFLGIPIVLLFIGAVIGKEQMERQRKITQMKRFRREAMSHKVGFSEEDKRTMVS
jgi:Sec-independent protein secretion pathway component TatC